MQRLLLKHSAASRVTKSDEYGSTVLPVCPNSLEDYDALHYRTWTTLPNSKRLANNILVRH